MIISVLGSVDQLFGGCVGYVLGILVCTVSFCDGGFYCFGVFMADKREKLVDRERARVDSEEIFRLMRGNGKQSRINDGKVSPS